MNKDSVELAINGEGHKISFDTTSTHFIRDVLNTNPTKYNDEDYEYFLGETFENSLPTGSNFTKVKLVDAGAFTVRNLSGASYARSPTIVSQFTSTEDSSSYTALFHFESLEKGSSPSREFKISIENVRASKNTTVTKYGTFDVVIRPLKESQVVTVLERFSGVNLDPDSDNYI